MDFALTEEQLAFADAVRRFAHDTLAEGALARAHRGGYDFDAARQLAEHGLLGITMKEEDGGQGGTLMDAVIAIQEVAQVCPKSADILQAGNFGPIRTFVEYATLEQKSRFLKDLLSGKKVISLGMTEPGAGSAVTQLKTSARKDGDEYVINGTKIFSTHSPDADLFLVYCRFGPGLENIGSVLIEKGAPGFTVGQPSSFMSGEEWSQLYIEECRIPAENVLLGPGGFKKQISGFNVERVGNASRALALGRYAFNAARDHALIREQFGKLICEFQGIQWKFADMVLKLEASQLLLYRAANVENGQLPSAYDTAIAKAHCNMTGFDVSNEALQVMGGMGYSQESLVEYCVRRTRGWMIAGGSIEMLKNRISETVFERRFDQRK
ncbi:acyl-CoA dehydrogenase family protein [Paraburkholderia caribensis]|uniref:acyl-CoA dehydrogenase family protein n=1 Tax=Paraburkholderia caribensis TaxID=75105 RepID=UPI000722BDA0|nr:acyl-CoA dehydrogenase [Paraburkholderia caribensis]ALP68569.1 acyl-CoA dehydrogenase [Paraburkholderia caribensis]AUT57927.1 acyl-CoA dehydrogenase [Paraburkholderia caribensis]